MRAGYFFAKNTFANIIIHRQKVFRKRFNSSFFHIFVLVDPPTCTVYSCHFQNETDMRRSIGILLLTMFFMTVLSGCEKKELLKHKSVYGEATINDKALSQYTTIGESASNKYWFLPLGLDNNILVKDGVCYLQMFLRDGEDSEPGNFWLILVGCYADEGFPIIGKEYKIVVQDQIGLGNIYNSFYWSGKLRDFYSDNSEFESYGVAGLSIPPSHDEFIPLEGSIQFERDSKAGEYVISYSLKSNDNAAGVTYRITGKFNGRLKNY